jgi:hypothetical protein
VQATCGDCAELHPCLSADFIGKITRIRARVAKDPVAGAAKRHRQRPGPEITRDLAATITVTVQALRSLKAVDYTNLR